MDNGGCPESCRNLNGSFECYRSCRDGYRLDNNRHDCLGTETNVYSHVFCISTDIDECAEGSDECEHMCMNTEGNYTCSCYESYLLADDGKSCTSK